MPEIFPPLSFVKNLRGICLQIAVGVLLLALPASGADDNKKIGSVVKAEGSWCRKLEQLKAGNPIYWLDIVQYCSRPGSRAHQIVIQFDSPTAREPQTYKCSTKGVCDPDAPLWVQGGYKYGNATSGSATVLISRPGVGLSAGPQILPDAVVRAGEGGFRLPAEIVSEIAGEDVTICRVSGGQQSDCLQSSPTPANPVIRVAPGLPGLYGVYRSSPLGPLGTPPTAVLLVVRPNSYALTRWSSVPEPYRKDSDPVVVNERRLFLLDLFQSETR